MHPIANQRCRSTTIKLTASSCKIHSDIASHKAGEERVLHRPSGGSKDRNDLRRRSRRGLEGGPSTALFLTANGRMKKGKRVTLFIQKSN